MQNLANRIPVSIIAGFLGAGKTTLLNNILSEDHGKKIAVLVNEFGEIGIDHALIVASSDQVIELANGCICCSIRGDLVLAIDQLLKRRDNFEYLLVETTGLADPAPVAQTFLADERMLSIFRLDGVITLIDSMHFCDLLEGKLSAENADTAIKQIAFADRIVVNKIDLVSESVVDNVLARIRAINANAVVLKTSYGNIDHVSLLNIEGFSLESVEAADPAFLTREYHDHLGDTQSIGMRLEQPIDIQLLNIWLRWLLTDPDMQIYRMKGVVDVGHEHERYVFQGVQQLFTSRPEGSWPTDEKPSSMITIIGRNLNGDLIRERLETCVLDPEVSQEK